MTIQNKEKRKAGFSVPFLDKPESSTRSEMLEIQQMLKVHTGLLQDLDRKLSKIMRHLAATSSQEHCQPHQQARRPLMPMNKCEQPLLRAKYEQLPLDDEPDEKFVTDNGVNLLSIRAVEPDKYALSLMDVLFTEAEMASCCYDNKKSSKPGLPPTKVQLLEECVARKFGRSVMEQSSLVIRKKCNQKCIDRANKSKQAQKPQKTQKLQ